MANLDSFGVDDPGTWLVSHRWEMDQGEFSWLDALGRFDAERRWARDGQRSAVAWLRWKTRMATSTCYEKVNLAAALRGRPVVADAFRDGRISYSAARLICRLDGPDHDTDAALVTAAERCTIRQLEQLVLHYQQLADQERPPSDPTFQRGVRRRSLTAGWAKIEITLPDLEATELLLAIEAFAAVNRRQQEPSARAEDGTNPGESEAVSPDPEPSARAEDPTGPDGSSDRIQWWRTSRADGLLDLAHTALAHADGGPAAGDDRYLLHLVATADQVTTIDGTPIDPRIADQVSCDSSAVAHTTTVAGQPLHLGRKTRTWSTAQRRAALVRDSGHCRFPGCDLRHVDLHHRTHWEHDGPTDIDNALCLCRHHHRLLHHGFTATAGGSAGEVTFHRPDGTALGSTRPTGDQLRLAA